MFQRRCFSQNVLYEKRPREGQGLFLDTPARPKKGRANTQTRGAARAGHAQGAPPAPRSARNGTRAPGGATSRVGPAPKIIFSRLFLDFETKSISQHRVQHGIVSAMHELVGVATLGKHSMYAWLIPTRYGLGTDAAKAKGEALLPSERPDPLV